MHAVGKLTKLTEEDMFNDNTNIDALADKCEVVSAFVDWSESLFVSLQVPEEVRCLLEDLKAKSNGTDEKSALVQ